MPFEQRTGPFKRIYKLCLIASSFGCTLWPFVVSSASLLLLPIKFALIPIAGVVVLALVPIPDQPPQFIRKLLKDAVLAAQEWLQISVVYDSSHFTDEGPYVIGVEPHSVLPVSIPAVMNTLSDKLPEACQNCHSLATSVVFSLPFARQIWWWLDIRPATRKHFDRLLEDGKTVCLNPGGVQECLYMRAGHEVAFLNKRLGFIRIALRHGAPLVPAFAFGQTDMYKYIRPGPPLLPSTAVAAVSRRIGFVPLLFWGWCGTTIPYESTMTVVLGDPIPTVDDQTDDPSDELCNAYSKKFIDSLRVAFEKHKADAGYPDLDLHVM
eukprot:jgi/Ulvmu1/9985/UM059_0034.1